MTGEYAVYGGDESYYTGKLEAYLRAKGIPYRLVPFGRKNMARCARNTGVVQIPQVECPDGSWLVDTTPIIAYFEKTRPEPAISPRDPIVRFVSLLLEDYADEWLWRPAMHYRWSYPDSARLMSGWLAEHLREVPLPLLAHKLFWRVRQNWIFVRKDGVNAETRAAVESSYFDTLDALEAIFRERPFVLGERPTQADFGFFASMFRHFFCDPHSGRIMRERAPGVQEWVARMWNLRPARFENAPMPAPLPSLLEPLLEAVADIYLPYLAANAAGRKRVSYEAQGVRWSEPVKPYRVWCLGELRRELSLLDSDQNGAVRRALQRDGAVAILDQASGGTVPAGLGELPIRPDADKKPVDSWWRSR
jgi:glutathione S-transferase